MPPNDGAEMSISSLRDDPTWQAALDWFMRIQAAPDDARLCRERDAWLAESAVHAAAYARAEQVWQLAGQVPAVYPEALAPPLSSFRPPGRSHAITRRRAFCIAGAALAAGTVIAFPEIALRLQADHVTRLGETRSITLADGSMVHLDADSAVDVSYTAERRIVGLLSGQAFFEVVSDDARPFSVTANEVTVTVTGTAFEVDLNPAAVTVAVQRGAVEVGVGPDRLGLAPGDRVSIDSSGRILRDSVMPDQVASWRGGRLVVDGATVADVVEEFRRYHRGLIVLRDETLAARRVTGVFDLHDPVAGLRAVLQPHRGRLTAVTPWLLVLSPAR